MKKEKGIMKSYQKEFYVEKIEEYSEMIDEINVESEKSSFWFGFGLVSLSIGVALTSKSGDSIINTLGLINLVTGTATTTYNVKKMLENFGVKTGLETRMLEIEEQLELDEALEEEGKAK